MNRKEFHGTFIPRQWRPTNSANSRYRGHAHTHTLVHRKSIEATLVKRFIITKKAAVKCKRNAKREIIIITIELNVERANQLCSTILYSRKIVNTQRARVIRMQMFLFSSSRVHTFATKITSIKHFNFMAISGLLALSSHSLLPAFCATLQCRQGRCGVVRLRRTGEGNENIYPVYYYFNFCCRLNIQIVFGFCSFIYLWWQNVKLPRARTSRLVLCLCVSVRCVWQTNGIGCPTEEKKRATQNAFEIKINEKVEKQKTQAETRFICGSNCTRIASIWTTRPHGRMSE